MGVSRDSTVGHENILGKNISGVVNRGGGGIPEGKH